MTKEEVQQLNHGLYKLHWKKKYGGGYSLASVGSLHDGRRWFAPSNWTSSSRFGVVAADKWWKKVKRAELIESLNK